MEEKTHTRFSAREQSQDPPERRVFNLLTEIVQGEAKMSFRQSNSGIFQQLGRIGNDHIHLFIEQVSERSLLKNGYEAFKYFIQYGFYRNRRDELAETYYEYAHKALDLVSAQIEPDKKVEYFINRGESVSDQFTLLAKETGKVHPTDCKFLKSVCNKFIPRLRMHDYNVLEYCNDFFEKRNLSGLSEELDDIDGVGTKIAALFSRDALMLYESQPGIKKYSEDLTQGELMLVYPIDTWVRKISKRILGEEDSDVEIAAKIIQACNQNGVSAIDVNHGIWYIGAKSQAFLFDNIERLDSFKVITV